MLVRGVPSLAALQRVTSPCARVTTPLAPSWGLKISQCYSLHVRCSRAPSLLLYRWYPFAYRRTLAYFLVDGSAARETLSSGCLPEYRTTPPLKGPTASTLAFVTRCALARTNRDNSRDRIRPLKRGRSAHPFLRSASASYSQRGLLRPATGHTHYPAGLACSLRLHESAVTDRLTQTAVSRAA